MYSYELHSYAFQHQAEKKRPPQKCWEMENMLADKEGENMADQWTSCRPVEAYVVPDDNLPGLLWAIDLLSWSEDIVSR